MLANAIRESGFKKKFIQERASITWDRLKKIEDGGVPTLTEAEALSQVLGIPVHDLFRDHIPVIERPIPFGGQSIN